MEKEFVPYELAVKLKALGFNEPCFGWFRSTLIPSNFTEFFLETEFGMNESPSDWVNSNFLDEACSAPLYQQAFRWFREKYAIYANINYDWNDEVFRITIMQQNSDKSCRVTYLKEGEYIKEFRIYEEAELECLNKLIEIVENK